MVSISKRNTSVSAAMAALASTKPQPEAPAATESAVTDTTSDAPVAVVVADPFADLATVTVGEYSYRDLTEAPLESDPRKYTGVHTAAKAERSPIKKGWKHASAMLCLGTNRKELRPSSVYGTIQSIVASYGRSGVPAYVVVNKVRQMQIGNKRSHFCDALPPVGWAEGWIDTFVSKGMGKVMEKTAPAIFKDPAPAEGEQATEIQAVAA